MGSCALKWWQASNNVLSRSLARRFVAAAIFLGAEPERSLAREMMTCVGRLQRCELCEKSHHQGK